MTLNSDIMTLNFIDLVTKYTTFIISLTQLNVKLVKEQTMGHLKCSAHSMFPSFPEDWKSIPKFLSGKIF